MKIEENIEKKRKKGGRVVSDNTREKKKNHS